jgi:hypothetical protein
MQVANTTALNTFAALRARTQQRTRPKLGRWLPCTPPRGARAAGDDERQLPAVAAGDGEMIAAQAGVLRAAREALQSAADCRRCPR